MAEIINLDDLVPEDVVFTYGNREFTLAGDLDTETVFKIFQYFREVLELRGMEDGSVDQKQIVSASNKLHDLLLEIFQIRDPELEGPLPFGAKSLPIITERILQLLGVGQFGDIQDPPTTGAGSPSPTKKPRSSTKASSTGTSPRSRGSRP